jgi:hypothetical protein
MTEFLVEQRIFVGDFCRPILWIFGCRIFGVALGVFGGFLSTIIGDFCREFLVHDYTNNLW